LTKKGKKKTKNWPFFFWPGWETSTWPIGNLGWSTRLVSISATNGV